MKRKLHCYNFLRCLLCMFFACFAATSAYSQTPANDDCSGAVTLTPSAGSSCTTAVVNAIGFTNATISTPVPASCATGFLFDVWYVFKATSTTHTITISGYGTKFTRRQLAVYEGNCGGLIAIPSLCSAVQTGASTTLSVSSTDFSPGTTYYIRVLYPNTINTGITSNGGFTICVTTTAASLPTPVLSAGRSYIIRNKPNGGIIQTGDTLEIRNAISVTTGNLYNVILNDTLGTGLSYIPDSAKFKTNEGMVYPSAITGAFNLTDASGDDEFVATTISGTTYIRANVGTLNKTSGQSIYQAGKASTPITYSSFGGGKIHKNGRPSFYGSTGLLVVTYLAKVTAATNTNFILNGGALRYKTTTSDTNNVAFPQVVYPFTSSTIGVTSLATACQNKISGNQFTGGDFGSGNKKHDSTQLTIAPGYTWTPFSGGGPQDGQFAVVNNSSAANVTLRTAPYNNTNRVFGLWDVIGDHTGAPTAAGNNAVPYGTTGGYMGVVNAAFGINTAISKATTGLCTDTYYEFSAWFKNICIGCSCDTAGNGTGAGAGFKPYLGTKTVADSTGVLPNLTFSVDGVDYYVTGDIPYNDLWVRKAFVFKTGSAQTTATLVIRNNAAGGGGNDWAMDDIQLSTCGPSLSMNFNPLYQTCKEAPIPTTLSDTVRYLYNSNYIYFKWQKKTIASGVWVDVPGSSGVANGMAPMPPNVPAPTLVNGQWQYVTSLAITPVYADSGTQYRVITGTSLANLSNSCAFTDGTTTMVKVVTCGFVLNTKILTFTGSLNNNNAVLNWQSIEDNGFNNYELQRSDDNVNFYTVGSVNSKHLTTSTDYFYNDPVPIVNNTYYRLKLNYDNGGVTYSNSVVLSNNKVRFQAIVDKNPFTDVLFLKVIAPQAGLVTITLCDMSGRKISQQQFPMNKGLNLASISNISNLTKGVYLLGVQNNTEQLPQIKVLKY